jgi:hypothetical protein
LEKNEKENNTWVWATEFLCFFVLMGIDIDSQHADEAMAMKGHR